MSKIEDRPGDNDLGDYRIGAEIGKGSFATVYKGEYVPQQRPVAIKTVSKSQLNNERLISTLESEIQILRAMKHPHIVSLLDYKKSKSHFYICMEYCSLGDLSYFIQHRKQLSDSLPLVASLFKRYPSPPLQGLHEELVRHFLKQLASALEFLRNQNLIHRDIKPQNLLLCPPKKTKQEALDAGYAGRWELPVLKLADFGFARILPSTGLAETLCGSPLYMAPEILKGDRYSAKADLWSVGTVLYEMITGMPPFRARNHIELLQKIEKKTRVSFPRDNTSSPDIKALVRSLLRKNPAERISFPEFFKDPVLLKDIDAEDTPLDQSKLDDNLFISEYINSTSGTPLNVPVSQDDEDILDHRLPYGGADTSNGKDMPFVNLRNPRQQTLMKQHRTANKSPLPRTPSPGESLLLHLDAQRDGSSAKPRQPSESKRDDMAVAGSGDALAVVRTTGEEKDVYRVQSNDTDNNVESMVDKSFLKLGATAAGIGSGSSSSRLDREYVVVEKRTVEVNALADALAHCSPNDTNDGSSSGSNASGRVRRSSNTAEAISSLEAVNYQGGQVGGGISPTKSSSLATRLERRMSIGYGTSPTNALTRALNMASARLFGAHKPLVEAPRFSPSAMVINSTIDTEERMLIKYLENLAAKANSLTVFAEVKYCQLVPEGGKRSGTHEVSNDIDDDIQLPLDTVASLAQDSLVLYVKTLSLLAKGMDKASLWWKSNSNSQGASQRLNDVIQWTRSRFNQCLERAEYAQSRLDSVMALSQSSGGHPISLQQVSAEKLIFDRALDMARTAACNEMVNEDLAGCELSYGTAIWMLQALLEVENPDDLNDEDRATVERFLSSINGRLTSLHSKLAAFGKIAASDIEYPHEENSSTHTGTITNIASSDDDGTAIGDN